MPSLIWPLRALRITVFTAALALMLGLTPPSVSAAPQAAGAAPLPGEITDRFPCEPKTRKCQCGW